VRAAFTGIVEADYNAGGKFATVLETKTGPESVTNVYAMVVDGFSHPGVAIFYIVGMVLLFAHLAHGVSSMFQSVGFRNEKWRPRLDKLAKGYAIVVAAGFIAIPVAVQAGLLTREGPKCCASCKAPAEVVVPAAK
jgi:succinate dehydrogenase/fumarate reductase cytochrome b subunit (b558 family)